MRPILISTLIALSTPALAQDCYYETFAGDRAYGEFAAISLEYANGDTDHCESQGVGTGLPYRMATCESGYEGLYSFHPSQPGGTDAELLVFRDDLFYRRCD